MATYKLKKENQYRLIEENIYGSSRLGIIKSNIDLWGSPGANMAELKRTLDDKNYEITNHLGNGIPKG